MEPQYQECLFIGGPKDGCRIKVEVGRPYRFLITKDMFVVDDKGLECIIYYPMKFSGGLGNTYYTLYVLDGMSGEQVFKALITRYPVPLPL